MGSYRSAHWARDSSPSPPGQAFGDGGVRARIPRFQADSLAANQAILDHVTALARQRGATCGQVALAWLLAQGPSIVPIPGTRRRERIDENAAATTVGLSADDIADLNRLTDRYAVVGDRYKRPA